jgi:predicted RNA binding protein YcfA (HicA-like mRNA interferase family)
MKLPRNLNGRKLANHLTRKWGFEERKQTGSHVILTSPNPVFHVSIPDHRPLRIGTLQSILSDIASRLNVKTDDLLRDL